MKILLFITAVIATTPTLAFSGATIQNTWTEQGTTYAVVEYKNTTSETFTSGATITCKTVARDGSAINTNTRSFFSHEYGPIKPGFTGTVKVPIRAAGNKKPAKVNCSVNEW